MPRLTMIKILVSFIIIGCRMIVTFLKLKLKYMKKSFTSFIVKRTIEIKLYISRIDVTFQKEKKLIELVLPLTC